MSLIPIEIGGGRVAHIRQETTIGELEDAEWIERVWVEGSPAHTQKTRRQLCLLIVCVRRWSGMPGSFAWPSLPTPLIADHPSIEERWRAIREHIGYRTAKPLLEAVQKAMMPDEKLEGN